MNVMGQGQVSDQSGTSWYLVITVSSYKVAVLIMSLINYVTHQYTNATQNTPHKTSSGEGLQSVLFLVYNCYYNGGGHLSNQDILVLYF